MSSIEANYRYWREHGGLWAKEYEERKLRTPLYHIQELMLTEYMAAHANVHCPTRVLEFGCGVGRHLRNISQLPGIDLYGFDQSPTMIECMRSWAGDEWMRAHVRSGEPVGPLPFEDDSFDIVYSTEVLVHVRPEHLTDILRELYRVARGHVLHLEPAPGVPIHADVHCGCWGHDLREAYRSIGLKCEMFDRGYSAHAPYRVMKDNRPTYMWEPWRLWLYRTCERALTTTIESSIKTRVEDSESGAVFPTVLASASPYNDSRIAIESNDVPVSAEVVSRDIESATMKRSAVNIPFSTTGVDLERQMHGLQPQRAEPTCVSMQQRCELAELQRDSLSRTVLQHQRRIDELIGMLHNLKVQHEDFMMSMNRLIDSHNPPQSR